MTPRAPTLTLTGTYAMVLAAEAKGVSVNDILAEAGVARSMLRAPESRLEVDRILALWNRLRERAHDPTLQLRAPTHLPFGSYGVIDYIVDASPTVGEAIHRFARFFRIIANNAVVTANEGGAEPFMAMAMAGGGHVPSLQVEYTFAAVVGRIRINVRPGLSLSRVELVRPLPADPGAYEEVFRAPVFFGADADRVCFTRGEWEAPTEHGDEYLVQLLERHATILAERLPGPGGGVVADVQQAILEALPDNPTAPDIARALHVSTRTLQRKLNGAGVTFSEIAEGVRAELAKEYLSNSAVPIAQVAFLLGFSEQSSFHRAFRRWTGVPPGKWRATGS